MKKRVLSLILALLLALTVAGVPSVSEAKTKKTTYTRVYTANKTLTYKFTVKKAKRKDAATKLNKVLGISTKAGSKFTIKINGKKYTAQNKKGTIYIGKKKLVKFITSSKSKKTTIAVKLNLKKALKLVALTGNGTYNYTMKIGKVSVTKVKVTKSNIQFTANKKTFKATVNKDGNLIIKGNVKNSAFVKNAVKAKAVNKVKTFKK